MLRHSDGGLSTWALSELVFQDGFRLLDEAPRQSLSPRTPLDALPKSALEEAHELLAHLFEHRTGYRSGHAALALPDEPRECYDPTLHSADAF